MYRMNISIPAKLKELMDEHMADLNWSAIARDAFERRLAKPGHYLNEAQIGILRDLQGFIDYAIANDLPFDGLVETIKHDLEVRPEWRHSGGYAWYSSDDVGEPDLDS